MKIGILRETKKPIDNRVALTPSQIKELSVTYPHVSFKVQPSDIRAYSDSEYKEEGIEVCENVDDCDLLLGIKEADVSTLLPNKHYIFFGHIAKKQEYNIPLFKKLLDLNTTFSDYEYLVDNDGMRLVAFGWHAGVVGAYYTLLGWGIKTQQYSLPMPGRHSTIEDLIGNVRRANVSGLKIALTGRGRVSQGAQYFLQQIGAIELSPEEYLQAPDNDSITYCVLGIEELVTPNNPDHKTDRMDFKTNPHNYHQVFTPYARVSDILLSCHYWASNQPVYLSAENYLADDFRIRMIGDITCDIQGSIKSTLRASTHDDPFYDYNPVTEKEEKAFSDNRNISVMAVDTCPNALPRITSEYFGRQFIKHVLSDLLASDCDRSEVLDRATIIRNGQLTDYFNHLEDYVKTF